MSFWSDASGFTKAVIVIGALGFLYFGAAFLFKLPPFLAAVEVEQQRGVGTGIAPH